MTSPRETNRGGARPARHTKWRSSQVAAPRASSGRRQASRARGDRTRTGAHKVRDRRSGGSRRGNGQTRAHKKNSSSATIPPPADAVRIIPLGGVEEVGRNMTVIEYRGDIVVVDAGFQFREAETPGVDYILPNTRYLEERKENIRAVLITHGHLDHIGGIPYILERIGNPPIYTRLLTSVMIEKRQEEFPHVPKLKLRIVEKEDTITLGKLKVNFFAVTHTIPDAMGIIVDTPYGAVVHTGDLKLEHKDGIPSESEEKEFAKFKNRDVLLLMADSTNAERPGFSIPESLVHKNIEEIIKTTKGRLIIGTFASQLERLIRIIEIADENNKKIVIEGRSMRTNLDIVQHLKLLDVRKGTIIGPQEMDDYPPDRVVALATGAQGDQYAALMRMANKTNKNFKVTPKDTVLLSSSIIPGNERAVQKLKDNLSRQGAKIIHYQVSDVHSSGHANRDETAWIHMQIKPKFFIPIHGYHYMLRVHGEIAKACGTPKENVAIPDNGMIIEIQDKGTKMVVRKEKAPAGNVLVDGFTVGDEQEVVLRDRQMLAEDGMFVIIASVNPKSGKLRKSPDIISRGFVYLRESQELLGQARLLVKKTIEDAAGGASSVDFDYIKTNVTDTIGRFLFQQTNKRPMVIPVLIGV